MRSLGIALFGLLGLVCGRPAAASLVINEIMYNSPGGTDIEFIELYNTGPAGQDLSGWYLLDDDNAHTPCQLVGVLAPGAYLAVAGKLNLFAQRYPTVTNVNPNPFDPDLPATGFALGNTTDIVRLFAPGGTLVDSVTYTDLSPWPVAADGDGPALELINPLLDNSLASSWAAGVAGGTPGAQNSTFIADVPPVIDSVVRSVPLPRSTDSVTVTAQVLDDLGVALVELYVDTGNDFEAVAMLDDGLNGDGAAGDSVYGAIVPAQPSGTLVRYFVYAEDTLAQDTSFPDSAPAEYLAYTVDHVPPPLVINEILASNQNGIRDEAFERDDWLEIYNRGPLAVDLAGMYLTDDFANTRKWQIPSVLLPPGGYIYIWCDNDLSQGPLHANFGLALAGGEVALYDGTDHGNTRVHGFTYGLQGPDRSFGLRSGDAHAPEYLATPTPGASNEGSTLFSPICINEFLASSAVGVPDWVELYNRGELGQDISGWFLSDTVGTPFRFVIPPGTVLPPGGRVTFSEQQLGFGLSTSGEVLQLVDSSGAFGRDYIEFGPQFDDVSQGRFPDGTSNWHFFSASSRDLPNSCQQGLLPLNAVHGLRFDGPEGLSWGVLAVADGYDLVRGDLNALRAAVGDFAQTAPVCVENNRPDPRGWDPALPGVGQAWFYLARGVDGACGFGTFDSGGTGQQISRDASLQGCP